MKTNCSSVCSIKAIQVFSLILLIFLTFTGVGSGNETVSISGTVHNDIDRNDKYDPGDNGIPDVYLASIKGLIRDYWPGIVWLLIFVFILILAGYTVIKLYLIVGKNKVGADKNDCPCNYLLLFVLLGTTFLGWTFYIFGKPFYIIPLIGIACLVIPLILSISADYNIGSKLDNGEIRKSIVISLTVIYIIFLAISFEKSIDEKEMNIQSYDADFTMKMDKQINKEIKNNSDVSQTMNIKAKINSSSGGFATPEKLVADFSLNKTEIALLRVSKENNSKESGGSVPLPASSANASSSEQMIPEEVMATFTKNFLYVYILIILFYFGSRFIDEYKTSGNLEKYLGNKEERELDIGKIVAARLAMGDIGTREYKETIDALGYGADKTIEVSKYALSLAIADVEKAYATWEEAEKQEKAAPPANRTKETEQLNEARKKLDNAIKDVEKKRKKLEKAKTETNKADEG